MLNPLIILGLLAALQVYLILSIVRHARRLRRFRP